LEEYRVLLKKNLSFSLLAGNELTNQLNCSLGCDRYLGHRPEVGIQQNRKICSPQDGVDLM
jgi:hypothetical protein